jgi:hypothetical protein
MTARSRSRLWDIPLTAGAVIIFYGPYSASSRHRVGIVWKQYRPDFVFANIGSTADIRDDVVNLLLTPPGQVPLRPNKHPLMFCPTTAEVVYIDTRGHQQTIMLPKLRGSLDSQLAQLGHGYA